MKAPLTLVCGTLLLSHFAIARSIPLARGGSLPIPDHAQISAEGVSFVRPGEANPTTVPWQSIDLARFARQEPEMEAGRQKALLSGEKTLVGPEAPKANPYVEFLSLPVKITFRAKETRHSRVDYSGVSSNVTPLPRDPENPTPIQPGLGIPGARTQSRGTAISTETTVDGTRPALDTSAMGFLELISDDTRSASGNLLREAREHPDVFANLLTGLRELQRLAPEDALPSKAAEALQVLARAGAVSVPAQRDIAVFLRLARERAGWR